MDVSVSTEQTSCVHFEMLITSAWNLCNANGTEVGNALQAEPLIFNMYRSNIWENVLQILTSINSESLGCLEVMKMLNFKFPFYINNVDWFVK